MDELQFERCEEDDPDRCQGISQSTGQCPFKAVPGTKNCPRHGANKTLAKAEAARVKQYRLQIWQERLDEFSESNEVKSLREEIGILRLVMETMLVNCKNTNELLIYSSKISDLATKIEKLVSSCHRLEGSLGLTIDKSTALTFAQTIVDIIAEHVQAEVMDEISESIINALTTLTGEKDAS